MAWKRRDLGSKAAAKLMWCQAAQQMQQVLCGIHLHLDVGGGMQIQGPGHDTSQPSHEPRSLKGLERHLEAVRGALAADGLLAQAKSGVRE